MFPHQIRELRDLHHVSRQSIILPGESEPAWLQRKAAIGEALRQPRAISHPPAAKQPRWRRALAAIRPEI